MFRYFVPGQALGEPGLEPFRYFHLGAGATRLSNAIKIIGTFSSEQTFDPYVSASEAAEQHLRVESIASFPIVASEVSAAHTDRTPE